MAEDTRPNQDGHAHETIRQVQQSTIERKQYGPLVEPAPDAFPLHYQSPCIPGPGANSAAGPAPEPAPAVNPGQSGTGAASTTSTQQQREGS